MAGVPTAHLCDAERPLAEGENATLFENGCSAHVAGLMIRDYQPLVSLNKALLGPYFLGVVALGGGTLGSHDEAKRSH